MRWIKTESGTTGTATSIDSGFFSVFAGAAFVLVSVSERKQLAIHPSCWVRSSRILDQSPARSIRKTFLPVSKRSMIGSVVEGPDRNPTRLPDT